MLYYLSYFICVYSYFILIYDWLTFYLYSYNFLELICWFSISICFIYSIILYSFILYYYKATLASFYRFILISDLLIVSCNYFNLVFFYTNYLCTVWNYFYGTLDFIYFSITTILSSYFSIYSLNFPFSP